MAFWSRKKPPAPPPPPPPPSQQPARVDPQAEVRWVPAASNPFGVEILDCRPFIRSAVAGIDDKHADSFARLRSSKGEEHRNAPPEQAAICPCELRYGHSGAVEDGPLFKAESMEDKWDVYLYDNYLYFARSSTGTLEYRARIHFDGREAHVIAVEARRELVHGDPGYAVAAVDFLIRSHLYGQPIPHPAWLDTHTVIRSGYRMTTLSTSAPSKSRHSVFTVAPSSHSWRPIGVSRAGSRCSDRRVRLAAGRSVIPPAPSAPGSSRWPK